MINVAAGNEVTSKIQSDISAALSMVNLETACKTDWTEVDNLCKK